MIMAWIMAGFVVVTVVLGIVVVVMFLQYVRSEIRDARKTAEALQDIASRITRLEVHITGDNITEVK